MLSVFIQGLTLGLAYLAPIGMQNLFVINSALSHRLGRAMATALVVVFWDVSLALACFFGAGALMDALPWLRSIVLGLGGLLVVCIGVGLIRSEADISCDKDMNQPFAKIILASFVVTWLNPQAIVDGTIMLGAFRATLPQVATPALSRALQPPASSGSTPWPSCSTGWAARSTCALSRGLIASAAL